MTNRFFSKAFLQLLAVISLVVMPAHSYAKGPEEFLASAKGYIETGEVRAAVIELKNALKQSPGLGEARFLLGHLYIQQGRYEAARKELRRAEKAKHEQDLWLGYSRLYNATREYDVLLQSLPAEPVISTANLAEFEYLLDLARYRSGQATETAVRDNAAGSEPYLNVH